MKKIEYGGSHENRYRNVRRVIDAVRKESDGSMFVRISRATTSRGKRPPPDFVVFGGWMKERGVDLIDASAISIASAKVEKYPGFQVPAADLIRCEVGIATGAVGQIKTLRQAEEILGNRHTDLVFIDREILKDPFYARSAADDLHYPIRPPAQYTRYGASWQLTQPPAPAAPFELTVTAA